jgi:hypothetical protein
MSAQGQFLPIESIGGVSALPLIATELLRQGERRKGPIATAAPLHDQHKKKNRQRGGPSRPQHE